MRVTSYKLLGTNGKIELSEKEGVGQRKKEDNWDKREKRGVKE